MIVYKLKDIIDSQYNRPDEKRHQRSILFLIEFRWFQPTKSENGFWNSFNSGLGWRISKYKTGIVQFSSDKKFQRKTSINLPYQAEEGNFNQTGK